MPSVRATLVEGWYYLGAFALLVFLLIFLQREAVAPYYATGALLVLNQFSREHRLDVRGFFELLFGVGKLLVELVLRDAAPDLDRLEHECSFEVSPPSRRPARVPSTGRE